MEIGAAKEKARADVGVLMPNVDPTIGEMVLASLYANEGAPIGLIAAALARTAPDDDMAAELVSALLEFVLCRDKGHLFWLEQTGQSILVGMRRATTRNALLFGAAEWPLGALMMGPPKSATVRVPRGVVRIWMAAPDMQGVVVRQSEAIALGNAMVESFGGRVLEDRAGPDVLRDSFIEKRMTARAKMRAMAISRVDEMIVEAHKNPDLRPGHPRVAVAEAVPGTMVEGMRVIPEGDMERPAEERRVFEVERRVNDSWVIIVAHDPRADVEGTAWWREDGQPPIEGFPPDMGFSDEPARAKPSAAAALEGT